MQSTGPESPSKQRAGVKPLNPSALAFEMPSTRVTPPPDPVGAEVQPATTSANPNATAPTTFTSSFRTGAGLGSSTPPQMVSPAKHGQHLAGPGPNHVSSPIPFHPAGTGTPHQGAHPSPQAPLTEGEFLYTRNMLNHVQRPALVAVLQSLMDDFPHLVPVIRVRTEKAMAYMMQQQPHPQPQPQVMGAVGHPPHSSPPGPGATNWHPSPGHNHLGPLHDASTPPGSSKKGGSGPRGKRDDDHQELCSIHNSMRGVKYLHQNPTTQLFECIPGFHCLVSQNVSRRGSGIPTPPAVGSPIPGSSPLKSEAKDKKGNTPPLLLTPPPVPITDSSKGSKSREGSGNGKEGQSAPGADPNSPQLDYNRLESLLERLRLDSDGKQEDSK